MASLFFFFLIEWMNDWMVNIQCPRTGSLKWEREREKKKSQNFGWWHPMFESVGHSFRHSMPLSSDVWQMSKTSANLFNRCHFDIDWARTNNVQHACSQLFGQQWIYHKFTHRIAMVGRLKKNYRFVFTNLTNYLQLITIHSIHKWCGHHTDSFRRINSIEMIMNRNGDQM